MEQDNNTPQGARANDSRQMVADRVKIIMQAKQLKLADVAQRCSLPPSNLSSIINGKRNPTLDTLDRLATALEVPTWHLLTDPAAGSRNPEPKPEANPEATREQPSPAAAAEDLPFDAEQDHSANTAPQGGRKFDLCTIDPVTGETRLYRLVNA